MEKGTWQKMVEVTIKSHRLMILLIFIGVFSFSQMITSVMAQDEDSIQPIDLNSIAGVEELFVLQGHSHGVTSLDVSGSILVSGSFGSLLNGNNNLIKRNLSDNPETDFVDLDLHNGDVTAIDIGANGTRLLSGSVNSDSYLILTDLNSNEIIYELTEHSDWVLSVAIRDDGSRGLSGSADTTVIYWDLDTGEPIHKLSGHRHSIWSVALSPDETTAASASCGRFILDDDGGLDCVEGLIIIWDLIDGGILDRIPAHDDTIFSLAYTNDGMQLLSGAADGRMLLWDIQGGEMVREFQNNEANAHDGTIRSISLSPSNQLVVSGARDGNIRIWNFTTGELLSTFTFEVRNRVVYSTAFSENYIAAGIAEGNVYVFGISGQ